MFIAIAVIVHLRFKDCRLCKSELFLYNSITYLCSNYLPCHAKRAGMASIYFPSPVSDATLIPFNMKDWCVTLEQGLRRMPRNGPRLLDLSFKGRFKYLRSWSIEFATLGSSFKERVMSSVSYFKVGDIFVQLRKKKCYC